MRGDAEVAGAALTALGAGFKFAVDAGLLALGAVFATTGRLPELPANQANAATVGCVAAAFAASVALPADEWLFRELFLLASGLCFLGGIGLLGSAVVEWRRREGSASP